MPQDDPKKETEKVTVKKVPKIVKKQPQPGQPEFFIEKTDTIVEGNPVFNVYEGQDNQGKLAACAYFKDGQLWDYSTNHKIQLSMNAVHRIQQEHVNYINERPIVPEAPKAPEVKPTKAPEVKQSTQPTKTIDDMIKEMNLDGDEANPPSVERIGASQPPKLTQPPKTGTATPTSQASPTNIKDFIAQTQKPETRVPAAPVAPTAPTTYVAPPTAPTTKAPPKAPEAPVAPTAPTYVAQPTGTETKVPPAPVAPTPKTEAPKTPVQSEQSSDAPRGKAASEAPKAPEVKPTKVPEAPKDKDEVPILDLTPVPAAEELKLAETPKDSEVKLDYSKQFVQDKDGIIYLHSSTFEVTDVGNYWLFKKDNKFYRLSDIAGEPKELKAEAVGEAACRLYNNMQAIVNSYIEIIDEDRDDITALDKDLEVAEKRAEALKSLEERINSEVQAKEAAQGALRALELEKKKLETDAKTYESTIVDLKAQNADTKKYEEQLTALKKQNEQNEITMNNLKVIAHDANNAAIAWEGQYNSILKEKESLGQAAGNMKEAILSANRNARETVANYQVLKQKYREAVQQNADLQAKLESKQ